MSLSSCTRTSPSAGLVRCDTYAVSSSPGPGPRPCGSRPAAPAGHAPWFSPGAARAAEGGAKALPRPRVDLSPSLAQRLGRGDRHLEPPVALHPFHARLGLGEGRPLSRARGEEGQHARSTGAPDVVPVLGVGPAPGEDHARATPHPVPEPAAPGREASSDLLQGRRPQYTRQPSPGHLMTLVPRAGRRHRRSSLLTRSRALRLPSVWRMLCTASQARRATRSSPAARCRRLS